jgi:uncharacterized protein
MKEIPVSVPTGKLRLRGVVALPEGPIRAGLIPLHPADDPSMDQFLFRHLAQTLPRLGVAVLRFDRRPGKSGDDVPLTDQVEDALAAARILRARTKTPDLPVGLWGWSQGAWAAPLAASKSDLVRYLILIASTGVSPAVQMRYGTKEHLRMAGFGQEAQAELLEVRLAFEKAIRGTTSLAAAQRVIDKYAGRPWFDLAYVRRELLPPMEWSAMDFDPRAIFEKVTVPTLLFYGENDEWSPVEESIAAWKAAGSTSGNRDIVIVRTRGTTHAPTLGGKMDTDSISPEYSRAMETWLEEVLPNLRSRPAKTPRRPRRAPRRPPPPRGRGARAGSHRARGRRSGVKGSPKKA